MLDFLEMARRQSATSCSVIVMPGHFWKDAFFKSLLRVDMLDFTFISRQYVGIRNSCLYDVHFLRWRGAPGLLTGRFCDETAAWVGEDSPYHMVTVRRLVPLAALITKN